MAAPREVTALMASARASMSTTVPREALMKMAPGFIMRSCSAPMRSLVEAVSGTQADDVGHVEQLHQVRHLDGVAQESLFDVVVVDLHADHLGDDAVGADGP